MYRVFSRIHGLYPLDNISTPSCDNQKCLQPFPNVFWGAKAPLCWEQCSTPEQRIIQPQMLIVPRLRNCPILVFFKLEVTACWWIWNQFNVLQRALKKETTEKVSGCIRSSKGKSFNKTFVCFVPVCTYFGLWHQKHFLLLVLVTQGYRHCFRHWSHTPLSSCHLVFLSFLQLHFCYCFNSFNSPS